MDQIKKINEIMVDIFNVVMKLEERAVRESSIHDLSITELHTLDAIGLKQSKTMSQVAWSLNISISTLTTAINKLVKKGYVERFRIPEDRRIVKIKLTEDGVAAAEEHEAFHDRMIREAISELDSDEVENFVSSIENISQFISMQRYRPLRNKNDYCLKPVKLGCHDLKVPLFQGGMGIGVSMGGLAGAVAACGGLGIVSAVEPGYEESDFGTDPLAANKRALEREIKKAVHISEQAGSGGLVGVNVTASRDNYSEMVRTALLAGARVIVSGGGLPLALPGICENSDAALIPIVSSARAARLIKRSWKKKHDRQPDAFIFESSSAGGYLGYKESQLDSARDEFYRTILELREEAGNVPLIAGGGIMSRKDAARAFAYGADGIQLGSSFIVTDECDAADGFKEVYLNLRENDVTIIKNPQGMPCRVINNDFVKNLRGELTADEEKKALIRAVRGDAESGLFFCGSRVYKMKHAGKVADVFSIFT
ncbi:MAG: nitronate monooxygenase [Eubacteriaceae bacterium]|nr:nitronate monooxygenase [Eubacteriaceae bacterium]